MNNFFTKERCVWLAIIAALITFGCLQTSKAISSTNEWKQAVANNKAYEQQLDEQKDKCGVFQTTINELTSKNKELSDRINYVENQNDIKDKQIQQLNYLKTELKKVDTVIFTDTIFKVPQFTIDTVIGDEWMNTNLHMSYPNTVVVSSEAKSDKLVTLYSTKETVEQPKKFFLCRWFQKKHTVVRAVIDEKNPYIKSQQNEFYQIIK